jgi:hypothetical protein
VLKVEQYPVDAACGTYFGGDGGRGHDSAATPALSAGRGSRRGHL